MDKFVKENSLTANAVFSFHKCNSDSNDDILIFDENNVQTHKLHGLRQQVEKLPTKFFLINYLLNIFYLKSQKDSSDAIYYSISDFIAPVETNKTDFIGCFAVTILGVEDLCKEFEAKFDDYK